jgi:methionyl-tRNA formyltransferase
VGDGVVSWVFLYGCSWAEPVALVAATRDAIILRCECTDTDQCEGFDYGVLDTIAPDLVVTAAWRHMVPQHVLETTPLGVVGFHSAKLPEYPGRAPVPWTILRNDSESWATMLYLTDTPDAGDIIEAEAIPLVGVEGARFINRMQGDSMAYLLKKNLTGLLDGTAPRAPQDRSKRGPLTKANGWQLLREDQR